jgi:hypothetical protein
VRQRTRAPAHSLVGWLSGRLDLSVRSCGRARGHAGVGVVYHTLAEPEEYLLHVILSGAYLCDVALNDALCDNLQDFHVLGAKKRRTVFGALCRSANGIAYPLILSVSVLLFRSQCRMQWSYMFAEALGVVCDPAR